MKIENIHKNKNNLCYFIKVFNNLVIAFTIFFLIRWELSFLDLLFTEILEKTNTFENNLKTPVSSSSGSLQKLLLEILLEAKSSICIGVSSKDYSFSFENLEKDLLLLIDKYHSDLKQNNFIGPEKDLLFNSFKLELMELFLNKKIFLEVFLDKKSYNSKFITTAFYSYFPARLFLLILFFFIFLYYINRNKINNIIGL